MTDMPELLPCPFCGKEPYYDFQPESGEYWSDETWHEYPASYDIRCMNKNCLQEVSANSNNKEQAIKIWNTRADLSQPKQEPMGDVKAALDALDIWIKYKVFNEEITKVMATIRAALTAQQPDVNQELLEVCKKAADIFRDYERIHLSKNPPDRSKAERNGEYAYVMEQAIARATQQSTAKDGV